MDVKYVAYGMTFNIYISSFMYRIQYTSTLAFTFAYIAENICKMRCFKYYRFVELLPGFESATY